MENNQKLALQAQCNEWLAGGEGYTQASLSAKTGLGQAYLSIIVNGKWTEAHPAAAQWQKLALFFRGGEVHIDSVNCAAIEAVVTNARNEKTRAAIEGDTGLGKSYGLRRCATNIAGAILITCRRSMGHKTLLHQLAERLGLDGYKRLGLYELENKITDKIVNSKTSYVLMFDELEYVKPAGWDAIKTLCDLLEGKCGIVICGIIEEKITKLSERGREGFPQFARRFDKRYTYMCNISAEEIGAAFSKYGVGLKKSVMNYLAKQVKNYDALITILKDCMRYEGEISLELLKNWIEKGGEDAA